MQLTNTISVLELAWTAIALVGMSAGLYAAREHYRDRAAAIQKQMPSAAEELAFAYLVNALVKTLVFTTYFVAGVFAMVIPNTQSVSLPVIMISLCLIAGELALGMSLVYQQYVRRRVLRNAEILEVLLMTSPPKSSLRELVMSLDARIRTLEGKHE